MKIRTTSYNPETNNMMEIFHNTLKLSLQTTLICWSMFPYFFNPVDV